jgi:hypothetical protein
VIAIDLVALGQLAAVVALVAAELGGWLGD